MLERIKYHYDQGLKGLKFACQNIDFAELTIQSMLRAGPDGLIQTQLNNLLAQAPLQLSLNISKEKNLGALPLVPYIINLKPQVNGDIFLEVH